MARFRRRLKNLLLRESRCPECLLARVEHADSPNGEDKICARHVRARQALALT